MTNTTKTIMMTQLILAIAMTAPTTASAQSMISSSVSNSTSNSVTLNGLTLQTNSSARLVRVGEQVKDDLFAGSEKFAKDATEVTEINLDPSTMGLVGRRYGPDSGLAGKMNFMVIHSYKYDKPGMYSMDDFQAYTKKLTDGSWNCSVHVREKNGSTDICSRTAADHETNEMVILTAEPKEITFIHMSGKMSLADLNHMSDSSHSIKLPPTPRAPVTITPPAPPIPPVPPAPSR